MMISELTLKSDDNDRFGGWRFSPGRDADGAGRTPTRQES
jgi:hypothetical protein